jgi:hypothetical protein
MKLKTIFSEYVNHNDRERQVGRYYASEVGQVVKGYAKPKDFFTKRKIDRQGVKNIMSGQAFETELKNALDHANRPYEYEPKKEIKIDDFAIVVKPDFVLPEILIETKFPVKLGSPSDYLERYKYQLECEYRAFEKKTYLGIFIHPFDLSLYEYHPSDKLWSEIQDEMRYFHKKVCEMSKKQS